MEPSSSTGEIKEVFTKILGLSDVFYRHQKKDEPDLEDEERLKILENLFISNPSLFLQRYHRYLDEGDISLFSDDSTNLMYFDMIRKAKLSSEKSRDLRNQRFLAMQKLKGQGEYFSLDKMRERDPALFDLMLGGHLRDDEKITLRPTEELMDGADYSDYMGEYEQCCSEESLAKRKRHLEEFERIMKNDGMDRFLHHVEQHEDDEFEVEFDSDDDEGRNAEIERQARLLQQRKDRQVQDKFDLEAKKKDENDQKTADQMSRLDVSDEKQLDNVSRNSSEDMEHDQRLEEFKSIMEERFLEGKDTQFYDYNQLEESEEYAKMKEQDEEDKYFDSD
ncbi:unnamed protein product [Bursaphelenchus xylophilus]|uniref:(pine wood nematode) hypothetical protein n=1 Tax=Bursaphelenchus xylophilus TaxID=6326 RepID=A0A1I7RJX4_BURXY|nr:unnamed protein product [Bursaphelenchus xylophilus]CAG9129132.1 unnamed protein product [Bursaphelenchus xylophilus]